MQLGWLRCRKRWDGAATGGRDKPGHDDDIVGHMLLLSFCLLLIAAVFGSVLATLHLRTEAVPPNAAFGVLHGLLGAVGLAVLLLALRGPPRGLAMGVGSFGGIAAALLVSALLAGLVIRRRRMRGLLIGIHATFAICGIVILAAYTFVS